MRIYVGTYAKYNSGSIKGEWLNLEDYSDKEEFYEACHQIHKDEEDPEFMFQDWEDIPSSLIGESWVSEKVWEIVDSSEPEAFKAFLDHFGNEATYDDFEDAYCGEWESFRDFADNLADELGYYGAMEKAGLSPNYFDLDAWARDLEFDYVYESGFVFRNY